MLAIKNHNDSIEFKKAYGQATWKKLTDEFGSGTTGLRKVICGIISKTNLLRHSLTYSHPPSLGPVIS